MRRQKPLRGKEILTHFGSERFHGAPSDSRRPHFARELKNEPEPFVL